MNQLIPVRGGPEASLMSPPALFSFSTKFLQTRGPARSRPAVRICRRRVGLGRVKQVKVAPQGEGGYDWGVGDGVVRLIRAEALQSGTRRVSLGWEKVSIRNLKGKAEGVCRPRRLPEGYE